MPSPEFEMLGCWIHFWRFTTCWSRFLSMWSNICFNSSGMRLRSIEISVSPFERIARAAEAAGAVDSPPLGPGSGAAQLHETTAAPRIVQYLLMSASLPNGSLHSYGERYAKPGLTECQLFDPNRGAMVRSHSMRVLALAAFSIPIFACRSDPTTERPSTAASEKHAFDEESQRIYGVTAPPGGERG